jgi:hypothetical protein
LFHSDLQDLLAMARWARDEGIPSIRLVIG